MDNIATLKLISGEELIAEVQSGSNPLYLTLVNPVLVHKTASPFGPMLSVSHWLMFTKENNIQIDRKNVVALKYGLDHKSLVADEYTKNQNTNIDLERYLSTYISWDFDSQKKAALKKFFSLILK